MGKTRTHLYYFDYLRIFACLCVIFMHTASGPLTNVGGTGWAVLNFATSLAFCAVPLFFMMSGYLLLSSEKTLDISVLFKHRIPRLLVPLAVWSIIASCWLSFGFGVFDIRGFFRTAFSGIGSPVMPHFWFMYTLIAIYLISPFLYRIVRSQKAETHILLISLCVLCTLINCICAVVPYETYIKFIPSSLSQLSFFNGHLATFILGYYIGSLKKKIPSWIPVTSAGVTVILIAVMTYIRSNANGTYDSAWQMQNGFFEVLSAVCIFIIFKQMFNFKPERLSKAVSAVSELTFPIYLMHNVLLSVFQRTGVFKGGTVMTFVFTLIIFAVCFAVLSGAKRIKYLSFPLCGIPYVKAEKADSQTIGN